jgi:ELWxxDGT repeat protein
MSLRRLILPWSFGLVLAGSALEALPTPQRVADLKTVPRALPFGVGAPFALGDKTFFIAGNSARLELWIGQEPDEPPRLALELCSELVQTPTFVQGYGLLAITPKDSDRSFFLATCQPGQPGLKTWLSDGSIAGTYAPRIEPFVDLETPGSYLTHHSGALWVTDLTSSSQRRLVSFGSRASLGRPVRLGRLRVFVVTEQGRPPELWTSDGTVPGTLKLADLPSSPFGDEIAVLGDHALLLVFRSSPRRAEIWRTDGTASGTVVVEGFDLSEPSSGRTAFVAGTSRVFFGISHDGPEFLDSSLALWTTDGTQAGTRLLATIPQSNGLDVTAVTVGDRLYLSLERDLWTSDGSPSGTRELDFDLAGDRFVKAPFGVLVTGRNQGAFLAYRVWALDGSGSARALTPPAETYQLSSGVAGAGYFFETTDVSEESQRVTTPWITDGTAEGTHRLAPFDTGVSVGPLGLASDGAALILLDQDLWRLDPRTGGRQRWGDSPFSASDAGSNPRASWTTQDRLFFLARSDEVGETLWSLASPEASPTRLSTRLEGIPPYPTSDGLLYWKFLDDSGYALYWTDGVTSSELIGGFGIPPPRLTAVGGGDYWFVGGGGLFRYRSKHRAVDRFIEIADSVRTEGSRVVAHGGVHYFISFLNPVGYRLWRTDGTAENTVATADLPIAPQNLSSDGLRLYFQRNFHELWASDGTTAGTRRLAIPEDLLFLGGIVPVPGRIFFVAYRTGSEERELWTSDGTDAGTMKLVSPLITLCCQTNVPEIVALGSGVVFQAGPDNSGGEPWWSDGTLGGTRRIADLWPGPGSSRPREFTALGGRVFFRASDPDHGAELWVTDGTFDGTSRLTDLQPGPRGSNPTAFAALGDRLFFGASDGPDGAEPWLLPLDAVGERPIPAVPSAAWLESSAVPGFRFQVRFAGGILGQREPDCIGETLCVSGAILGRPEVFLRIVGPRPNGFLWPTLVKFTTSEVEIWIEQEDTGQLRYYTLAAARPGVDELPARFDRLGFQPTARTEAATAAGEADPPPTAGSWFESAAVPGFRVKVAIARGAATEPTVRSEIDCIAETLCVSGAIPGRSEAFVRVVGPRPNGFLWPIVARFTGSRVEVWIEQKATGEVQYYELPAVSPADDALTGAFDRTGFEP